MNNYFDSFKTGVRFVPGWEVIMEKNVCGNAGIKALIKKYKKMFRKPENLNHYSEKDYQIAERKFLKYLLFSGKITVQ